MQQTPAQRVGAELRRARKEAGVTLEALGAKIGKSKGQISGIETGRYAQSVDTLEAYAHGLGLRLIVFLDGEHP
jgi:transcriptional regulator with XRE-family HTH domain